MTDAHELAAKVQEGLARREVTGAIRGAEMVANAAEAALSELVALATRAEAELTNERTRRAAAEQRSRKASFARDLEAAERERDEARAEVALLRDGAATLRAQRDEARAEADRLRDAGLLLRADIRCNNGCGCEEYDYCAADEWDKTIVALALRGGDGE